MIETGLAHEGALPKEFQYERFCLIYSNNFLISFNLMQNQTSDI